MEPGLVIAVVPALVVGAVIYLFFLGRFREHAQLIQSMSELLDRQEKELAASERQLARLTGEMKRLGEQQSRAGIASEEQHQELIQQIATLRLEYDKLEKKMDHVQDKSISTENAKQLMESPLVAEILDLLNQGVSPMEIAQRKGMQVGEITLIKSLRKFAPEG